MKMRGGDADYERILDALVLNASIGASPAPDACEGFDRLESADESMGGRGDDESMYSMTSQMSTMSTSSSSRMTAGQRRRWHKQQQMQTSARGGGGRASSSASRALQATTTLSPTLSTHPETPSQVVSAVAGRQQSFLGSRPYLCEVFHDSYGIGTEPARGLIESNGFSARNTREGGTEFYPPSGHVPDLLVFNTARNSYGPARAAASASAGAPTSGATHTSSVEGASGGELGARGQASVPQGPPNASVRAAGAGAGKESLAHLVFKADAHADSRAAPALDLPASLPEGLSG